jgi:gluconokinase
MISSKPAVLLGIDAGTSGVRAALFDEDGNEIPGASAQNLRDLSTRTGFAEIHPEAAIQLVVKTIDDLLAKRDVESTHVELISVSCFWHSLLAVDASNRAITPILTWADTRASEATNSLRNRFDENDAHTRTGCRFHPSYWPAKLCWLRSKFPRAFQYTRLWLGFGEYLALRLCDQTTVSISMASATGLLNQRACEWDQQLIRDLEIPFDKLPMIAPAQESHSRLNAEFARRWPQLSDARVYPAIGDGVANNIGAGCHGKEKAALMVGTSGALRILYAGDPPSELPGALWCYRLDRRRIVIGGALSDGGGLYRWLVETLVSAENAESLQNDLARTGPDAHGLTILPFWAGERSTGWAVNARGAIVGLSMETQAADILRAAMEGVAYRFALILKALEQFAPDVRIFGSGNALKKSPLWVQIIADVINRPVSLSRTVEASNRGAALLALEAAGKIQNIEEFSAPVERVFQPEKSLHETYREALDRQEKLYGVLMDKWS